MLMSGRLFCHSKMKYWMYTLYLVTVRGIVLVINWWCFSSEHIKEKSKTNWQKKLGKCGKIVYYVWHYGRYAFWLAHSCYFKMCLWLIWAACFCTHDSKALVFKVTQYIQVQSSSVPSCPSNKGFIYSIYRPPALQYITIWNRPHVSL